MWCRRHGESENVTAALAGALPSAPLTEHGRHQAVRAAKTLADKPIQRVCSSTAPRAHQTAEHLTNQFGKAIAVVSSFVQMSSTIHYPRPIQATPRKTLRIFLQAGHRDVHWNDPEWSWLASNLRVAAAPAEAGHSFRLVLGDAGHSPNHGGVLLPDALRWVFRRYDPQTHGRSVVSARLPT